MKMKSSSKLIGKKGKKSSRRKKKKNKKYHLDKGKKNRGKDAVLEDTNKPL